MYKPGQRLKIIKGWDKAFLNEEIIVTRTRVEDNYIAFITLRDIQGYGPAGHEWSWYEAKNYMIPVTEKKAHLPKWW